MSKLTREEIEALCASLMCEAPTVPADEIDALCALALRGLEAEEREADGGGWKSSTKRLADLLNSERSESR